MRITPTVVGPPLGFRGHRPGEDGADGYEDEAPPIPMQTSQESMLSAVYPARLAVTHPSEVSDAGTRVKGDDLRGFPTGTAVS